MQHGDVTSVAMKSLARCDVLRFAILIGKRANQSRRYRERIRQKNVALSLTP